MFSLVLLFSTHHASVGLYAFVLLAMALPLPTGTDIASAPSSTLVPYTCEGVQQAGNCNHQCVCA